MWLFALMLASAASADDTYQVRCWEQAVWDVDRDGYADNSAPTSEREIFSRAFEDKMTCPEGWVRSLGDCDDDDPEVRPRRWEVSGNGVDDDCNGLVDDHQFYYAPSGYDVTDTSFEMLVRLSDGGAAVEADRSPLTSLSYKVTYEDLEDTSVSMTTAILPVDEVRDGPLAQSARVTLDGLDDGHVYRAKVQFFSSRFIRHSDTRITRTVHVPIGNPSTWYYGMTSSPRGAFPMRTSMVNRALYERYLSELERVGRLGTTPDGTRYGATMGEAWCTEFYNDVAQRFLADMGHIESSGGMMNWFDTWGQMAEIDETNEVAVRLFAQPGDYLAMDTSVDDEHVPNHSAMVLAYDIAQGNLITVDGNIDGRVDWGPEDRAAGNEVGLRLYDMNMVHAWGRISLDMAN